MIPRQLASVLLERRSLSRCLYVGGARQVGKTTLLRATFPDLPYVNLEALDTRTFAETDPRGFLANYPRGALLDEVQRVPTLFSWLQGAIDDGVKFVLSGSQNFLLMSIGILNLHRGRQPPADPSRRPPVDPGSTPSPRLVGAKHCHDPYRPP